VEMPKVAKLINCCNNHTGVPFCEAGIEPTES
jgi:hypothetical protein